MIIDRPRKLPISTIRAGDLSSAARFQRRRAWSSVIQPSTSETDSQACANVVEGEVTMLPMR